MIFTLAQHNYLRNSRLEICRCCFRLSKTVKHPSLWLFHNENYLCVQMKNALAVLETNITRSTALDKKELKTFLAKLL